MTTKASERLAPGQTFETEFGKVEVKDCLFKPNPLDCGVFVERASHQEPFMGHPARDEAFRQRGPFCPCMLISVLSDVPPKYDGCQAYRVLNGLHTVNETKLKEDPSGQRFAEIVADFQAGNLKGRLPKVEGRQADCIVFEFKPKSS